MRLFIVYLWNYIRVLLYGKLFKKKGGVKKVKPYDKSSNKISPSKEAYLTYRSNSVGDLPSIPSHKKRIKNRNNRKRRHKK